MTRYALQFPFRSISAITKYIEDELQATNHDLSFDRYSRLLHFCQIENVALHSIAAQARRLTSQLLFSQETISELQRDHTKSSRNQLG